MGRIIVEQIITADGFVQDSDGGMSFMDAAPIDSTDSDQLEMLEHVGAIVLAALLLRNRATTPVAAALGYLTMLALGAPALFIASFPAGMAVADTFLVSGGGDHSGWSTALYLFSTVALTAAAALPIADALRRRSAQEKPRGA